MAEINLTPRHDSRKSFYGKAKVGVNDGELYLRSYDTIVAKVNKNRQAEVFGTYSQTTTRHIKEFLKQQGFKADTTKEIKSYIKRSL